jgi:hypothetical protein
MSVVRISAWRSPNLTEAFRVFSSGCLPHRITMRSPGASTFMGPQKYHSSILMLLFTKIFHKQYNLLQTNTSRVLFVGLLQCNAYITTSLTSFAKTCQRCHCRRQMVINVPCLAVSACSSRLCWCKMRTELPHVLLGNIQLQLVELDYKIQARIRGELRAELRAMSPGPSNLGAPAAFKEKLRTPFPTIFFFCCCCC